MRPEAPFRVFIGWDAAEMRACNVAETSLYTHAPRSQIRCERISRVSLLREYHRPTTRMPSGQLFDEISGATMSTEHALARFFIPCLLSFKGWALFTDGDVLFREDVRTLFALADPRYAVMVVQHPPMPESDTKKGGQIQQAYARKNWSSCCLWNAGHRANAALTLQVLNSWSGRELHGFRWLKDSEIGALPSRWNHLVGVQPHDPGAALVHYTLGAPDIPGHEDDPFADEWFAAARVAGYRLQSAERATS